MVRVKSVSEGIANRKETKMNGSMRSWLCAVCMGLAAAILNVGCEGDGGSSKSAAGTDTAGSTVSPPASLPAFSGALTGSNPLRVRNPNDFSVAVGVRSGNRGDNFTVAANGVQTIYLPNGKFDIYFIYSSKPEALYQGDSFTLADDGIEIQIVQIINGNYDIHQVN